MEQNKTTRRLFNLIERRGWEAAMLSDVAFGDIPIREYQTKTQTWTMIVRGKVAIALSEGMAARWIKGGAEIWGAESKNNRSMALRIPRNGRRRGITIIAYITHKQGQKSRHRQFLHRVTDMHGQGRIKRHTHSGRRFQ